MLAEPRDFANSEAVLLALQSAFDVVDSERQVLRNSDSDVTTAF